jgi:hypothetical protein
VSFGEPIRPAAGEHRNEVMERVRAFFESQAREAATPAPAPTPGRAPLTPVA